MSIITDIKAQLPTTDQNNLSVANVLGENAQVIEFLQGLYDNEQIGYKPPIDVELYVLIERLESISEVMEDAYNIDGILIPKNAFQRNLVYLGSSPLSDDEKVFTAATFGLHKSDEEIKMIAAKLGLTDEIDLGRGRAA